MIQELDITFDLDNPEDVQALAALDKMVERGEAKDVSDAVKLMMMIGALSIAPPSDLLPS